jgi:PAS domain S-box-containing protein
MINRAAENFLGASCASIIGRTVEQVCPKESAAAVAERDRQVLLQRRESFYDEHRIDTPGNGTRYATSKRILVLDENGDPFYLLTIVNNVIESRLASERIAHISSHDILIGSPNRAAFAQRLAEGLSRTPQKRLSDALHRHRSIQGDQRCLWSSRRGLHA